jgi:hypothetical protein
MRKLCDITIGISIEFVLPMPNEDRWWGDAQITS